MGWKPILMPEQRRTPLCDEDCKFCHDPRCFPNDEWVKLHVHRTPAARKRAAKKQKTLNVQENSSPNESASDATTPPSSTDDQQASDIVEKVSKKQGQRWADISEMYDDEDR